MRIVFGIIIFLSHPLGGDAIRNSSGESGDAQRDLKRQRLAIAGRAHVSLSRALALVLLPTVPLFHCTET